MSVVDPYLKEGGVSDITSAVTSTIGDAWANITAPTVTSLTESKDSITAINEERAKYGKNAIRFDQRAYELAVARSKDMFDNDYFDHVNPKTGECSYTLKSKFGFRNNEFLAENAFGAGGGSYSIQDALPSWMTSRGHRYNLLYDSHYAGAFACYGGYCVFEGVNNDNFGEGCSIGEEGMAFWKKVEKQPGEV